MRRSKYMKRKSVCLLLLLLVQLGLCQAPYLFTVTGKIDAENLGFALPHEHVMSNFGADPEMASQYDEAALMEQVVPYLKKLKSFGVESIFDGTTAYFGRNVTLLESISVQTGVQIITNTGFYGAADDRYVPNFAYTATADKIAEIWISEFESGIDSTAVRPGFIKLAFDNGDPSEIDVKLFEAGVLTHLKTGLTLAVHTGNNPEAVARQLELLQKHGVSPSAWIWIHANKSESDGLLLKTALLGAWISLDGVNASNIGEYLERIAFFKKQKVLHRVLLSHDGNSFPRGASIREYHAITEVLIPRLRELGYSEAEIDQLTVENPKSAYTVRIRKR